MFSTKYSTVVARCARAPWLRTAAFAALVAGIALATAAVGLAAAWSPVAAASGPVAGSRVASGPVAGAGVASGAVAGSGAASGAVAGSGAAQERRARHPGWRSWSARGPRADGIASAGLGRWARRFGRELELTDEQRDGLRDAIREVSDARRDSRRAVADARRAFRQAVADPERTEDEIRGLGEALGRAQAEAAVARRGDRERILSVLTPEQRERAGELRERDRNRRDRRGPRFRSR